MKSDGLRHAVLAGAFALSAVQIAYADERGNRDERSRLVAVDCVAGQTIGRALTRSEDPRPLVVVVRGICNESVVIERSDVTLRGDPAFVGGVSGPDPETNTVQVMASRVTIEGLTVTGGRNGITGVGAGDLVVRNVIAESTGRNGITYNNGSSGRIDGCTVRLNGRDGIVVEGAQATITNSTISRNRIGIQLTTSASARIGVTDRNEAAGNTISENSASGVFITLGSSAFLGMNQVTGNGTDPNSSAGRQGVAVTNGSSADFVGGNVITNNTAQGIFVRGSSANLGNPNFGLATTVNTISGNGEAGNTGGVSGFLGSALVVRDALITGNRGGGLNLFLRSQVQLISSTITNNLALPPVAGGDGIRMFQGSGLTAQAPASTVSGNQGFGLLCGDLESSVLTNNQIIFTNNATGTISCTGF